MKLKHTFLFLMAVTLFYAACKKTTYNAPGATATPKQVTSQIALNISEYLLGSGGAVDISSGLDGPSTFAVHTKGKTAYDLNNPFCGLVIDTTLNYSVTQHDTTIAVSGSMKFSFTCVNDILAGYTTTDNITTKATASAFNIAAQVNENFSLLSVNPADSSANYVIKGTLSTNVNATFHTTAGKSGVEAFSYTFNSVQISTVDDGDLVGGSATFTTTGTGASGVWNYSGTIVFLGKHLATVTINGTTYTVNLETGIVS